jgi:hypothetical protein
MASLGALASSSVGRCWLDSIDDVRTIVETDAFRADHLPPGYITPGVVR